MYIRPKVYVNFPVMLTNRIYPIFFNAPADQGAGSTAAASEGDQSTPGTGSEAGTSVEGVAGGSQPTVEQLTAERDRIEAERRTLQSERDRLRAELAASSKPEATPAPQDDSPLSRADFLAMLRRERELGAALPALKQEFTMADPGLFDRVDEFDTAEAFRAAVESSDASFRSRMEAQGLVPKSEIDALREAYVAKYGPLGDETPADNAGGSPGGLPTFQQLAAMTIAQQESFVRQHGEDTFQRILRSAQQEG